MTTRTEAVIARLRDRVLDGTFGPGTHLHEAVLAQNLGVSRTPIRDALRILGSEGLLVYSPNRGYVVRRFWTQDVLDAYDLRATLEGMAARVAAERGLNAKVRRQLTEIIEGGESVVNGPTWSSEDQAEWRRMNSDFHQIIVEFSANQHLILVAQQMRRMPRIVDSRLEPNEAFYQSVYTRERRQRSHAEHCEIFDALINRQGSRAESLMREHVFRGREILRVALPELEKVRQADVTPETEMVHG